jgi:hypothetical protein
MKNVEYEISILEATIDNVNASDKEHIEHVKK